MYNNDHEVELPSERRRRAEMFEEPEEHHTIRWIVIAIVAAAFIGLGWYTSDALTRLPAMPATLAQFPRLQTSFAELHGRVTDIEAKLQDWLAGQQELQQNVTDLQKQVESRFQAVRQQARALSAEVYQRVHAETAAQAQGLQTRLTRLESTSEAERARVETLQAELAVLRQETARQAAQLRVARDQVEHDGASRDQQLVSLNQRLTDESRDVDGLAKKLEVKRVDFEVTKNHSQQLAAGGLFRYHGHGREPSARQRLDVGDARSAHRLASRPGRAAASCLLRLPRQQAPRTGDHQREQEFCQRVPPAACGQRFEYECFADEDELALLRPGPLKTGDVHPESVRRRRSAGEYGRKERGARLGRGLGPIRPAYSQEPPLHVRRLCSPTVPARGAYVRPQRGTRFANSLKGVREKKIDRTVIDFTGSPRPHW